MKKISKESPALSVAIVNYNAGDLLADCVQAVLASPVDLEVVISDNGSTDGSLTHVRRHHGEDPRLTILEHGSNLGFARGNKPCPGPYACPLYVDPESGLHRWARLLRASTRFYGRDPGCRNGWLYDS